MSLTKRGCHLGLDHSSHGVRPSRCAVNQKQPRRLHILDHGNARQQCVMTGPAQNPGGQEVSPTLSCHDDVMANPRIPATPLLQDLQEPLLAATSRDLVDTPQWHSRAGSFLRAPDA